MKNEEAIKERLAYWKGSLVEVNKHIENLTELILGFFKNKKAKIGHLSEMESKEVRKAIRELGDKYEMERTVMRLIEELKWILEDGNKG